MIDPLPTQAALKIGCVNLVAGNRSPLAQCCNTHTHTNMHNFELGIRFGATCATCCRFAIENDSKSSRVGSLMKLPCPTVCPTSPIVQHPRQAIGNHLSAQVESHVSIDYFCCCCSAASCALPHVGFGNRHRQQQRQQQQGRW